MLSPRDDLQELDELQEDDASKQDEPNAETIIGDTPDDTVALKANTRGKSLLGLESRPLCHGRWRKVALAPLTRHDRDGRFMPLMRRWRDPRCGLAPAMLPEEDLVLLIAPVVAGRGRRDRPPRP